MGAVPLYLDSSEEAPKVTCEQDTEYMCREKVYWKIHASSQRCGGCLCLRAVHQMPTSTARLAAVDLTCKIGISKQDKQTSLTKDRLKPQGGKIAAPCRCRSDEQCSGLHIYIVSRVSLRIEPWAVSCATGLKTIELR